MGLAASQARFLAITARKADCEFQSMSIAQEKLSITRQLSKASSDYEDALDSTKLVWDYDDETSYDLTYDILMSPSELNGYTPYLLTNAKGQIVLDTQLATAAANAGIEESGGTAQSQSGRDTFVQALADAGYISGSTAAAIVGNQDYDDYGNATPDYTGVEWSALAGYGGDTLDKTIASAVNLGTMLSYLNQVEELSTTQAKASDYADLYTALTSLSSVLNDLIATNADSRTSNQIFINGTETEGDEELSFSSLFDDDIVLNMDNNITVSTFTAALEEAIDNDFLTNYASYTDLDTAEWSSLLGDYADDKYYGMQIFLCILANIMNVLKETLVNDEETETTQAFNFALTQTLSQLISNSSKGHGNASSRIPDAEETNGLCEGNGNASISLSNIASMLLTNYAIALDGYSSGYYIGETDDDSYYVTDNSDYYYIINNEETYYDEKDLMIADYINVLYNQLCTNGWTTCEGGDLNDSDFLQSAIKSGVYFISSLADDGYYYQSGYTSNGCVTEVTDEDAITLAEAEYDRIQTELNYKEETLDLELQNLDLEISSLTTEYDTIKSMISKNIEKVFTMFSS